jgi:hypothetical protein
MNPNLYRLPFDQFQRYRLVAEIVPILEAEGPPMTVLEVGGYPPQLAAFLPGHEVMVADQIEHQAPGYLQVNGDSLPFPNASFDLTVSLDTLEHVSPDRRPAFLAELCRVSRAAVIVAAPFADPAVAAADRAVFEFIKAQAGYEQKFLKEHLDLAPPDLAATSAALADRGLDLITLPSGRLDRWMMMMAAYYTLDSDPHLRASIPAFMEAYNRAFHGPDKSEPAYRHFLVGAHAGLGGRKSKLAALISSPPEPPADHQSPAIIIELGRTLALKAKDREADALRAELAARDAELAALKSHVAALEDFMAKVKSLPLYTAYEKFFKHRR